MNWQAGDEIQALGAHQVRPLRRAACVCDMACLYRLHLQARLPFRLLREMARFRCGGRDDLYDGIRQALNWGALAAPLHELCGCDRHGSRANP